MNNPPDSAWANWFAGFCDGEASFTYRNTDRSSTPIKPRFKLTVQEDHELIREINETLLGGGYVMLNKRVRATRNSGSIYLNRSELDVTDKVRLRRLVEFFDEFPLRSHKRNEYPIWRELVLLYCGPADPCRADRMIELVEQLTNDRVSGMSQRGRRRLEETKLRNKNR